MPSDEERELSTWESEGGQPAREIPADPTPELTELFRQLSGTYRKTANGPHIGGGRSCPACGSEEAADE